MEVANAAPREHLTAAQVVALIEADNVEVSAGLELYDADETFLQDISGDLVGGTVDRGNYRAIHGTCQLRITRELQWGSQRVKPYMTLSSVGADVTGALLLESGDALKLESGDALLLEPTPIGAKARFNLGVFLLSTPDRQAAETPATWDVEGYDKLEILKHPHGSTYAADAGDAYLTLVAALITGAGESKILIDQSASATTLPTARIWPLDTDTTTLGIVNDLLAAVGYRSLWVGPDGYYRSEPYVPPSNRGPEWTYSADSATTTVAEDRVSSADYFDAPNRWVFLRDDPAASTFPAEGDGIITIVNQADGPTSIDQRGRTITTVVPLDAASQSALASQADRIVAAAKRLDKRLTLSVGTNALHSHFDVVTIIDAQLGINGAKYVVTDWSMPLTGEDTTLELKAV